MPRNNGTAISEAEDILSTAISYGASDIHFMPVSKNEVVIRFRIDGALKEAARIGSYSYRDIVYYLKQLAGIQTASNNPESKRLKIQLNGSDINFRMESAYSFLYESAIITLRYIPADGKFLDIDKLGFDQNDLLLLKNLLSKDMGMILVSGPTGSGKTTTLYSSLKYIQQNSYQHILTVEQPVDMALPGITQLESRDGFSISELLKSAMRHDPDCLMIGEIRDPESAVETLKAAQTGHLVLTTLHANSALTAIAKMINYDLDTYNFITSTRAVLSQRLIQRLCDRCKERVEPDEVELFALKAHSEKIPVAFYAKGKGCEACNGNGYTGRKVIYELFPIDREDQDLIIKTIRKKVNLDNLRGHFTQKYETKTLHQRIIESMDAGKISLKDAIRKLH